MPAGLDIFALITVFNKSLNKGIHNLARVIPLFEWLPAYKKSYLKGDFNAGLTVGVMLIPQGMAYAMLAGLPPIYGLYASIFPMLIYAIFGSSRHLGVGPVAMDSLLISAGVTKLAVAGSDLYIELAIMLALMVGVIQFVLGLLRLGFLVNFLSHPVIKGFTSAAAIIIALSQLKFLLGIDIPRTRHVQEIIWYAIQDFNAIQKPTLVIGFSTIVLMLVLKKVNKNIPAALTAVILSILLVYVFRLDEAGVSIVRDVPKGLPSPSFSHFNLSYLQSLMPLALTIALVAFLEAIAVAKSIQQKHKDYDVRPNQELIALGLANIGGSFFRAFPTTGGFSRSAVNDEVGAHTNVASLVTAALIVLTLLFLTPLFYYLPHSVLAAIIVVAVAKLIDLKEFVYLWRTDKRDFSMLLITFGGTLMLGIEQGIGLGVILSLIMVIYRSTMPHMASLGRVPGKNYYRNVQRFPEALQREDILIIRFDAELYFANTRYFYEKVAGLIAEKGDDLKLVILNCEAINNLDSSAIHALNDLVDDLRSRDIAFNLTNITGPVRDILFRTGFIKKLGKNQCFTHISNAIDYFDTHNHHHDKGRDLPDKHALQSNVDLPSKVHY